MHCSQRLIVQTLVFSHSYLHRQVSPPGTLVVKGGTTWARNGQWILPENARLPLNIQGSFTCLKSTTWDRRLYFPSEGRRAEDFFALKNPTALVGFEPANLGTEGQHASCRPPKPLYCTLEQNQQRFAGTMMRVIMEFRLPTSYGDSLVSCFGHIILPFLSTNKNSSTNFSLIPPFSLSYLYFFRLWLL